MTASEGSKQPREGIEGLVEAFTGLAEAVVEVLPSLAEETQRRLTPHLAQAKMLGQLTVTFGSYELRRRAKAFVDAMAAEETPKAEPTPEPSVLVTIDDVIADYDALTAAAIVAALVSLNAEQLDLVIAYEQDHRKRTTVLHRASQLRKSQAG